MTVTTVAAPTPVTGTWNWVRGALIALAIGILLVVSFAVGRVTVSESHGAPAPRSGR